MRVRKFVRRSAILAVTLAMAVALAGCGGKNTVPDVVGKSKLEAVRILQDAGYKVGDINTVYTNQVPVDYVAATNPVAGAEAKKGTKVTVSINGGVNAEIVVPNVVGVEQADAEEQLKAIRLVPIPVPTADATVAAGVVIAQVPAPGSKVAANTEVAFQVSTGPAAQTIAVPNVVGKSQSSAESAIKSAGLTSKAYTVFSDTVAKGNVIGQSPAAGAKVAKGTEVGIAVSLGKGVGAVTVPNVVGKKEADAVSAMQSAGLKPKVYKQYSDTVATGLVIQQLPAAGTTTASGAEVGIAVSLGKQPTGDSVAVPNVVGKTEAEATGALEAAGFIVQSVEGVSEQPQGNVYDQLPVTGSTAPKGTTVVIAVSSGPSE